MLQEIAVGVISGVILAGLGALWWYCLWPYYSSFFQPDRFSLRFVNREPPGETEVDRWSSHPIPLGTSEHWIKIICNPGLNLAKFNFRFIPLEDLSRGPDDPPANIRPIIFIRNLYITTETLSHGHQLTQVDDTLGGIGGTLSPPLPIGSGKSFFIKLFVHASQPWRGKLSFEGLDNNHATHYGRADVYVHELRN